MQDPENQRATTTKGTQRKSQPTRRPLPTIPGGRSSRTRQQSGTWFRLLHVKPNPTPREGLLIRSAGCSMSCSESGNCFLIADGTGCYSDHQLVGVNVWHLQHRSLGTRTHKGVLPKHHHLLPVNSRNQPLIPPDRSHTPRSLVRVQTSPNLGDSITVPSDQEELNSVHEPRPTGHGPCPPVPGGRQPHESLFPPACSHPHPQSTVPIPPHTTPHIWHHQPIHHHASGQPTHRVSDTPTMVSRSISRRCCSATIYEFETALGGTCELADRDLTRGIGNHRLGPLTITACYPPLCPSGSCLS